MKHIPIRLGPLAVILTVISICMTTLGILTFSTAQADYRLAERYADTVRSRCELEAEGQNFLWEAALWLESGGGLESLDGVEMTEDGMFRKEISLDDFTLTMDLLSDGDGKLSVFNWRMRKDWEPGSIGNLWMGE